TTTRGADDSGSGSVSSSPAAAIFRSRAAGTPSSRAASSKRRRARRGVDPLLAESATEVIGFALAPARARVGQVLAAEYRPLSPSLSKRSPARRRAGRRQVPPRWRVRQAGGFS